MSNLDEILKGLFLYADQRKGDVMKRLGSTVIAVLLSVVTAMFLAGCGGGGGGAGTSDTGGGGSIILQPDPFEGLDVWITSYYSYGDDYGVDD